MRARATSCTTRRSPAPSRSPTCASARGLTSGPTSCSKRIRRSASVRASCTVIRVLGRPKKERQCCSTVPTAQRSLAPAARCCPARGISKGLSALCAGRLRGCPDAAAWEHESTRSCRRRFLRSAVCFPGTRRLPRLRRRSRRPTPSAESRW